MITVGFSTRKHNPQLIEYLKESSGLKGVQVIEKINTGNKSLSTIYNEIINESETDIIVLCHDDLYFDSKKWGEKLVKHFSKCEHGILGVAGTTYLPKSGQWWEDTSKMVGIVNHESDGKKWESKYSEDLLSEIKDVVIVDGLFIAIDKTKIKKNFDESVKGFHMYDINFCFENYLQGVKVGVIYNVRITHKSVGKTNEQWDVNRQLFSSKFSDKLPAVVKITGSEKMKILVTIESLDNFQKIYDNEFFRNKEVTLISNNFTKENKKEFNSKNIKTFRLNEIPGYKLGDGRSFVKTPQGVVKSELGSYYKTQELNYDLIICDSKKYFDIVKFMYSFVPKIFIKSNLGVGEHDSIVCYIDSDKLHNFKEVVLNSLNEIREKKQKIKICSGYSDRGGSTTALISLTNYFNSNGIDCTFYGPHKWHLTQCKSDLLQNLRLDSSDKLITHYLQLENRPPVSKVILSCHELDWFPIGKIQQHWDKVVFLHDKHREFHSDYFGEFVIIPNLKDETLKSDTKKPGVENVCGIIGTIETRKQTHKSIIRAQEDNCEKILVFGKVGEEPYFKSFVEPLLEDTRIELVGYTESKQEMYDSIGKVYHSSMGEVACLVKDECFYTGTKFFGNEQTEHQISELTNKEILTLWKNVLEL